MTIYLIDGSMIDDSQVKFDPATYQFYDPDTGQDLTDLVYRADKLKYPGFDQTIENKRVYDKKYKAEHGGQGPPPVGSTSTLVQFADLTRTDIINTGKYATEQVVKPLAETVIIFGIAGLVVYLLVKGKV